MAIDVPGELKNALLERAKVTASIQKLGMEVTHLREGYCEMTLPFRDDNVGMFQSMQGGYLMTLADHAGALAVFATVGKLVKVATTDMNIRFLRPCLSDCTCKATVIKFGRTLIPTTCDLFDAEGKLVAIAQCTFIQLGPVEARKKATP